tara:strand:+ start:11158 stop:13296 length:2139 start_codon:yes stop_codon:yes gene_type:complete
MKKNYVLAIFIAILTSISVSAQVSYTGNGNSGFGAPVGDASMTINDDGTTITFTFTKGGGDFNDAMVMYISTGATGRSSITGDVNDTGDDLRKAISNIGSGDITFPAGFATTHAVAINTGFGGLWSISPSGSIGANGLTFVDAVGGPSAAADASFSFSFDWTEIGLTSTDKFDFVITYGNPTSNGGTEMFSSDEAFGDGISATNPGLSAMTFTGDHSYPNTWTGTTDSDWATATNWTEGVPSSTDNVYIPNVTNQPTAAGAVTINKGVVKSDASLIAQSTFSGTITSERTLGTNNWYLVSSPVSGETLEDLITNNDFDNTTGTGSNIGIGTYNNNTGNWDYLTAASTGPVTIGAAIAVKFNNPGNISVIGSMSVIDEDISITDGTTNEFNLIGNPYPSFIPANTNADGTNNILTINSSVLAEQTIWFWNQATSSYDQVNQATDSRFIDPLQGFFVESTSGGGTFSFTEAMQSHQSTSTFQRTTTTRPEINLTMSVGSSTSEADIFYIDGTTTGFDNGYDSSIFGGVVNELAIYTQAVANGTGRNLGIQSLPDNDYENMVIPVGIIATNGAEITIAANATNLPAGINVYLEDKDDSSFTLLDGSSNFTTTLTSDLNGIGRFYIHTSSSALSIDDVNLENISIYTSNNNNLRIVGVQSGNAQVKIYNILGKQVLSTSFEGTGVNDISLPNVRAGVYIIQLETENGTLNKKVIIE